MEGPVRQFVVIFELMNHSWRQRSKIWSRDRFKPGRMGTWRSWPKKEKQKQGPNSELRRFKRREYPLSRKLPPEMTSNVWNAVRWPEERHTEAQPWLSSWVVRHVAEGCIDSPRHQGKFSFTEEISALSFQTQTKKYMLSWEPEHFGPLIFGRGSKFSVEKGFVEVFGSPGSPNVT